MRPRVYSGEKRLGEITEEVVKKSRVPIVLIKNKMEKFENCMLPYDGSSTAEETRN